MPRRRLLAALAVSALVSFAAPGCRAPAAVPAHGSRAPSAPLRVLRLDYAYYNPVSLVLKELGWVEREFAADGIRVEWVLSLGSNKANEHLRAGAVHFASTAGSAALLARANGVPLKTVWIYSQPEWTALVTRADGPVRAVSDLRGRKVAATRGTDPWFFLLRALHAHGLTPRDVSLVHLQHPDGLQALLSGQVDAWAGLDPHMADAELRAGARLFFRRREWNTYGFLNVLEPFLRQHPDVVVRVLRLYARGRQWVLAHPEEAARVLARAAGLPEDVARRVLAERTGFPDPVPGAAQRAALEPLLSLMRDERLAPADADLERALGELLAPEPARRAVAEEGGT